MSSDPSRMSERYGRSRASTRTRRVLIAVLGAAFLAGVVFVGVNYAYRPVNADTVTYEHLDDSHLSVTFTVSMSPGTEATCAIQALNDGRGQVGFVSVDIPAQTETQTTHEVEIATQGDAVSGHVVECERT